MAQNGMQEPEEVPPVTHAPPVFEAPAQDFVFDAKSVDRWHVPHGKAGAKTGTVCVSNWHLFNVSKKYKRMSE